MEGVVFGRDSSERYDLLSPWGLGLWGESGLAKRDFCQATGRITLNKLGARGLLLWNKGKDFDCSQTQGMVHITCCTTSSPTRNPPACDTCWPALTCPSPASPLCNRRRVVNHARRCRLAGARAALNNLACSFSPMPRASNMCCRPSSPRFSFKTETSPLFSQASPTRQPFLLCYVIPCR
jgi:hypothetical protein